MAKNQDHQMSENFRILATQIETINQQLAGGSGSGSSPAMQVGLQAVETKLNFLYEFVKSMQVSIQESEGEYFNQVGSKVTSALNSNLTQLFSKLQDLHKSLSSIEQGLGNSPTVQAKDISDMKKMLSELAGIYKDEVLVFKQQNEFLQQKLIAIEKKLDNKK